MKNPEVINFAENPSLISRYMLELRDVTIQKDPMRFRRNLERIGEIMAYEMSRRMEYRDVEVETPLGIAHCQTPAEQIVLATILRAGLPFHQGFLSYFDHAENAFVSAYRRYKEKGGDSFDVLVEYLASPNIDGKTLILVDPMLATGSSMELGYRAMLKKGTPAHIHVASVIASRAGIDYVKDKFPENTTIWTAAIDDEINAHSYIIPGLGDAGDLAYGEKEDN
ncbi:MAG: uracil phosphoribosyltransferase [Bacteroidales bacterium]|nr:uracil phosphoribosyltransferase [Bacteroidales bacterium]MBD5190544.1 uracil phosphoribosyltransferase [Bacteroidales bacterium]MBD5209532.1 uracil phosphoribosyltransferase [Bacteroidales bacterium]MDE6083232.1 uracil phosphoribosyltransferase [Muribaculaceae bacterium]